MHMSVLILLNRHIRMNLVFYFFTYIHVAGKQAMMTGGVSQFNKDASTKYSSLEKKEKEKFIMRSEESRHISTLSRADIVAAGSKIFRNIQKQVKKSSV